MKSITCGAFSAIQVKAGEWRLSCSRLPDWEAVIVASERVAMDAIMALQAEYRDSWKEEGVKPKVGNKRKLNKKEGGVVKTSAHFNSRPAPKRRKRAA